jgi:hypothetical protein
MRLTQRPAPELVKPFLLWSDSKMTKKINKKERAPLICPKCDRAAMKGTLRISELLATMIQKFEDRLKSDDFKPTLGDYLKLLQMEQEIEQESPKEVKVTWVDPVMSGCAR